MGAISPGSRGHFYFAKGDISILPPQLEPWLLSLEGVGDIEVNVKRFGVPPSNPQSGR